MVKLTLKATEEGKKGFEKLHKEFENISPTPRGWKIKSIEATYEREKKCYKCGKTEKECPDFYKTKDTNKDICGDCYGMQE